MVIRQDICSYKKYFGKIERGAIIMKKGILLIGMPGCGKTTFGTKLSEAIDYEFIDMDYFIEKNQGKTIKQLFENGEPYFRQIESESCEALCTRRNVVVASGGGIVKNKKNIDCFKDFVIVFINRPLELILSDIDTGFRPLLKDGKEKLIELYRERIDLYEAYSDVEVINDGSMEQVLESIKVKVLDEIN